MDSVEYIMPAEWESHVAVWLAWPYDTDTFPQGHLEKVEARYIEIIKVLSESEIVKLIVLDEEVELKIQSLLFKNNVNPARVLFFITEYADVWLRDYGPMFVKDKQGQLTWIKWVYDAYNKKFPMLLKDNEVFVNLQKVIDHPMQKVDMVLEGGSIEQNGLGTILTTEQCLLNSGRNPGFTKEQIEHNLKKFLGGTNIIWLKRGLLNDHTDGHIDDVARFVSVDTILCSYEEDQSEENYFILKQNFEDLENARDQDGKSFKIVKLPIPHLRYDNKKPFEAGSKAPVSYTNFYIGSKVILIPSYNDPNDSIAFDIIQSYFPDRKAVAIDCTDIVYGGGALHCMTQQELA